MKRTLATVAAVAALTFSGAAFAQNMGEGFNMLQAALENDFQRMGIPTDTLDDLTLGQIAAIKSIVESNESDNQMKGRIEAIIANN